MSSKHVSTTCLEMSFDQVLQSFHLTHLWAETILFLSLCLGGKLTKASGKGTAGARKSSKSKAASSAVVKEEASLAAEAGTSDGPKVKKRKVSIDHEKARPVKIEDGESVEKTKPKKAKLPKAKPSTANGSATDLKVEVWILLFAHMLIHRANNARISLHVQ